MPRQLSTRPTVALVDGVTRQIEWPEIAFHAAAIPGVDRDAVILLGVEPNYRWRRFNELVVELARERLVLGPGPGLAEVGGQALAALRPAGRLCVISFHSLEDRIVKHAMRRLAAAGTVAKTISAYDMAVSDAIYGPTDHYVSRQRLRAMLDYEYDLLVERLDKQQVISSLSTSKNT